MLALRVHTQQPQRERPRLCPRSRAPPTPQTGDLADRTRLTLHRVTSICRLRCQARRSPHRQAESSNLRPGGRPRREARFPGRKRLPLSAVAAASSVAAALSRPDPEVLVTSRHVSLTLSLAIRPKGAAVAI